MKGGLGLLCRGLLWQRHAFDDVDHAVRLVNIRDADFCEIAIFIRIKTGPDPMILPDTALK